MIELKIEEKTFTVPSCWEDLSFRQYLDILNVIDDKHLSTIETFMKKLCVISKHPELEEEINKLSFQDFTAIREAFAWMNKDPEPKKEIQEFFLIDGEKWSMKKDYDQLSTGEAVSAEILFKDKKVDLRDHEIAFGVLFRKVKEDGSLEDFDAEKIGKFINDYSHKVPLIDVFSVVSFFLSGGSNSCSKTSKVTFRPVQNQKMSTQ